MLLLARSFPWMLIKVTTPWLSAWYTADAVLFISEPSAVIKEGAAKVRLLPYVLVPNMNVSSRVFHKALATIDKQSTVSAPSSGSTISPARKAQIERLFHSQQGTSRLLLHRSLVLINFQH